MMHQRISSVFADDPDMSRVIVALGSRVADYAATTRRLAHGQFTSAIDRDAVRKAAIDKRELILSRARSAGMAPHEEEDFWREAAAHAGVEIFPIPQRQAIPSAMMPPAPTEPTRKLKPLRKVRGGRA